MMTFPTRGALRRSARMVVAGATLLAAVHGAAADDSGLHEFFSSLLPGSAGHSAAAPAPIETSRPPRPVRTSRPDFGDWAVDRRLRVARARPLTVHLHQPRIVVAQGPTRPVKVSILEDRTLQVGDAVMTAKGIRIFAGSTSWPYTAGDFVGLDTARHLSKDTSKVLAQIDRLPRG